MNDSTSKTNLLFTPTQNWEAVFTELFKNNPDYKFIHTDKLGEEFKDPRIHIVKGGINLQINSNFGAWGTWDVCAGHAILSALGGVMTDYYGNDINYSKPMLENGFIASDSLERIRELPWIGS
jgi:basic membrane lipoprotein Med (substrate-binding protein (PBP1-ABC) superfamily)